MVRTKKKKKHINTTKMDWAGDFVLKGSYLKKNKNGF